MVDAFWVTIDKASELTGVPPRILREWQRARILTPDVAWDRGRGQGRLYSFQDLIALRLLLRLRNEVPSEELRKIQPWIRNHQPPSFNPPPVDWDAVAVDVHDGALRFVELPSNGEEPEAKAQKDGRLIRLGEIVDQVRRDVEFLKSRKPEDIGRVTRKRGVLGFAWIIAGTRIPTSAIWSFHEAGYDTAGIIKQYPSLLPDDVDAAIEHERKLRERGAA